MRLAIQVTHCLVQGREAKDSLPHVVGIPSVANVIEHVSVDLVSCGQEPSKAPAPCVS
jgi:hypothetical protein